MVEYKIVNLVAVSNLNTNIDLFNIAVALPNIEYEPEQFPGAIMELKEPKAKIIIFKNGKINCVGLKTEKDIPKAIYNATKILHEVEPNIKIIKNAEYKIVNLVAHSSIDKNIDLFDLAMELDNVEYEPEQFPGAIIRIYKPRATLLLFKNGKIICSGTKSEKEIVESINVLKKTVEEVIG